MHSVVMYNEALANFDNVWGGNELPFHGDNNGGMI